MPPLPTITIDLSWVEPFLQQPPDVIAWTIFTHGGFLPLLWLFWTIAKVVWLASRQAKYAATLTYAVLNVNVPRSNEQTPKAVENIFTHISGAHSNPNFKEKWWIGKFNPPFSFELACVSGYTQFIARVPTPYRDLIEAAVFSQYPDAEISEIADYSQAVPSHFPDPEWECWGTEFVLAKDNALPIRVWKEFEHELSGEFKDPLSSLLESMARLKDGEQVWIQVLVSPAESGWNKKAGGVAQKMLGRTPKHKPGIAEEIAGHATDIALGAIKQVLSSSEEGHKEVKKEEKAPNLSPGEKKVVEAIENKISKIGFNCKMRMIYVGKRGAFRKGPVISMIKGALGVFGSQDANSFKVFGKVSPKTDYFWQAWSANKKKTAIMEAYKHRSTHSGPHGFILNVEELASIWHFPQIFMKAPLIRKVESKKVEPPFTLPTA